MTKASHHYISNPLRLLQPSWEAIKLNLGSIIGIYLVALVVPAMLAAAGTVAFLVALKNGFSLGLILVLVLLSLAILALLFLLAPAVIYILLQSARGKKVTVSKAYKKTWRRAPAVLAASLLTALAFLGGLVLFVIPGFIFATWFSFSPMIVVDEGIGAVEAMRRSKALVKNHLFEMWGMYSFSSAVNVLSIIPILGSVAAAALSLAYSAAQSVRYLQLIELQAGKPTKHETHWMNYVLIVVGLLLGGMSAQKDANNINKPADNSSIYTQQLQSDTPASADY